MATKRKQSKHSSISKEKNKELQNNKNQKDNLEYTLK